MSDRRPEQRSRLRHDLRTPLHQIIGYAELLEDEAKDRGDESCLVDLGRIRAAAKQVLAVVDEAVPPAPEPDAASPAPTPALSAPDASAPAGGGSSGSLVFKETAAAAPVAPSIPWTEAAAPPAARAPARLLVVDDNEMNRDMLSRRLGARGFSVETASDGLGALQSLSRRGFDLVLLDVMMPVMSGLEVLKRVRERWPASDLPVVMATARDASEDVVEALRLGANDYVTKPIDFGVVLARIETQLELRRQKQEIRRLADHLEVRNRFIRSLFGRYLSDEVVAGLLASPEGPRLGGETRRVTLLMSDLRGFTQLTEELPPAVALQILNSYLGVMVEVVLAHQGTIDEFVGDAILALFGAPLSREDDARRAVSCAVAMQVAMAGLNRRNEAEGLPRLEMGIAVHTGDVVVGNIGSERRTKYGVVGSAVNHAGRIESFTVGGQVLVSEATRHAAGVGLDVGPALAIDAKGTRDPIVVYDLRGLDGARLPDAADHVVPLREPLDVECHFVVGKRVEAEAFDARLVQLSARGGTLLTPRRLRTLSNLKLEARPADREPVVLYAKVVRVEPDGTVEVRFTAVTVELDVWLRQTVEAEQARRA